jgi:hypothetical protein
VAKQGLVVTVQGEGIRETLAAFRGMPRDAQNELRAAALDLSLELAAAAKASGEAEGSQAALVAGTVKAMRDRVPVVQAGGSKRLGSRRKPAWKLLFGSEFGSNRFRQFPRLHQGRAGVWFFPVIEENAPMIAARWREAADNVIRAFATRGD